MSKNETPTKVIVPCRFSYLHCWEPEAINGGEPKYSVSAIIPKSDKETIKKIQAAVKAGIFVKVGWQDSTESEASFA